MPILKPWVAFGNHICEALALLLDLKCILEGDQAVPKLLLARVTLKM